MNRTEFAQSYLVALYLEHRRRPNERPTLDDLKAKYRLPRDEYLETQVLETLQANGWTGVQPQGSGPVVLEVTFQGKSAAENFIDGGRMVDSIGEDADLPAATTGSAEVVAADVFDSSQWTGLTEKPITAYDVTKVISAIREAEQIIQQRELTNEQRAQALTYLRVARELAEVAEPPSDIIWQLIERAGAICGVIGLFVTLFLALA